MIGALAAIRGTLERPMLAVAATGFLNVPALLFLAIGAPVAVIALGSLLAGFALMFGNSVWEATLQRHVPIESLSRVSAYDWFGSLAFQPIGAAIWGPIAAVLGIEPALLLASGIMLASTAAIMAVPDIRGLRSAHPGS